VMRDSALLPALLLVAPVSPAQDSPAQRRGPEFGTFSNLEFNEDTGDVLGFEITVIPGFRTAYVIFSCAEGAPETPVFGCPRDSPHASQQPRRLPTPAPQLLGTVVLAHLPPSAGSRYPELSS
jgi:hypothetical protein